MHRLARILDGGVAQDGDLAGLAIDLDVDECVARLGPAPCALMAALPTIGPPVLPAVLAISASDSPLARRRRQRACPSSQTTSSSGISQIFAARSRSWRITSRAASITAMPLEKVTRLPPVRKLKPSALVSPMIGLTLSSAMPSSSAAIIASEAREPPMSGVPATSVTLPSSPRLSAAQVSPPMLNQNPEATPRPWFALSGAR